MHPVGRNLVAAQVLLLVLLLLLLLCSLADALGSTARLDSVLCHMCGGSPIGPDPPPPCRPGVLPPPRPCPPGLVGCLTSFNGTSLTRACGDWAYKDCQKANGVVYCYCYGRLCNNLEPQDFRKWFPSVDQYELDNDDEDDNDDDTAELGSGDFDNDGGFVRSVGTGSSWATWPTSTRGVTSTTSAGSTTITSTTTSSTTSRTTTPITSTPGMRAPSTVSSSDGDLFIGGSSSSRESTDSAGSIETTNSLDAEVDVGDKKNASAASAASEASSTSLWVLTLAPIILCSSGSQRA